MDEQTETCKKLIFGLIKKVRAHIDHELKEAHVDITSLQYGILVHLNKNGVTLNELSIMLANKPPTLIPAIDHLETEGYIKKQPDSDDRRKVQIIITNKGKEVIKKMSTKDSNIMKKGLSALGKQKTEVLISLLKELTENIVHN